MSSTRQLKKNVNNITDELMIDSFTYGILFPEKKSDELGDIITAILAFRTNTLDAINSVKNESLEPIRKQFKAIEIKMEAEMKAIIDRMQKLHS